MAVRDCANEPLAARAAAVKPGHFGGGAALVDEDQTLRAQFGPILYRASGLVH
jgi:hypothetical protein